MREASNSHDIHISHDVRRSTERSRPDGRAASGLTLETQVRARERGFDFRLKIDFVLKDNCSEAHDLALDG